MKVVNFVGYSEKTELMLYVAKIISSMKRKVLYIDSTTKQKCRSVIPTIEKSEKYITTFEEIDIAIGFKSQKEIVKYLNENGEEFNEYDYVFIDIDSNEMSEEFNIGNANYTFLVTSYDKHDVIKTIEILQNMVENKGKYMENIEIIRVFYYSLLNTSDEKYIKFLMEEKINAKWNEKDIFIPLEEGDKTVIIQNQYADKIKYKFLSKTYKKALVEISANIENDTKFTAVERVFKNLERRM